MAPYFHARAVAAGVATLLAACSDTEAISEGRYLEPDELYRTLERNVRAEPGLEVVADIDHSRLAVAAGSPMPPSHVLIWSDPALEAAFLAHDPRIAVDLPLRALAFEEPRTGRAAVIANGYDDLARRHSLPEDEALRARYEAALATATAGLPADAIARFPSDTTSEPGLVTLESPFDFARTEQRILDAIQSQSDTTVFARVDFAARSKAHGVVLEPTTLILFGAPGPGGKAMASAPRLGLDAFCQKLLVWQDAGGAVRVTFNDLVALAERQGVPVSLVLRHINRRVRSTLESALED